MLTLMSLVTSIKDYVEVVHKLIETDPNFHLNTYFDFGSLLTFSILSGKQLIQNLLTFQWFQNFWSIPTLIPDVASAMISEISVFDGYFQNTQNFLESPISYGNNNFFIYCLEKFMIGLLNSVFLCLPTSIAHIITLRRFVMQGLEAGFYSGLGTIAGNLVWIGSIVFGLRFFVIPWLSLDLFRYFLGFLLIVKYMWDSYTERRMVLEDLSKYKIFFLTFLLSFTEQTTIYPFLSNIAIGSDSTILESFPTNNVFEFGIVHFSYLLGILLGSLSFLQFTCWFWENPAFQIYMWFISSFKATTSVYSKLVNLLFLYVTMICAISNISYFGLDYTLTNPLGFVHEDRLLDQKDLLETSFLNTKASDRNTRRNRGRHGRRERWKRRVRRYRTFDASLYDQGVYDLLTLEDLNYGFDRFWLRRKIRNHRVRFRFFPGPWMRSFKKQLSRPRLESFMGPRVEFFRILFEQAYHPEFHEFSKKKNILKGPLGSLGDQNKSKLLSVDVSKKKENSQFKNTSSQGSNQRIQFFNSIYWNPVGKKEQRFLKERATLRKFLRKVNSRIQVAKIENQIKNPQNFEIALENSQNSTSPIYPKSWKSFSLSEINRGNSPQNSLFEKSQDNFLFQRLYRKIFLKQEKYSKTSSFFDSQNLSISNKKNQFNNEEKKLQNDLRKHLSKKERFLERYKTFLKNNENFLLERNSTTSKTGEIYPSTMSISSNNENMGALSTSLFEDKELNSVSSQRKMTLNLEKKKKKEKEKNLRFSQMEGQLKSMTLLHPLKFYMQKEQALKKKYQFYGVKLFRNFGVENNAPYFRVMMKRFFSHYKPSLRWERTLRVATMRKARRKSSRIQRKLNISKNTQILGNIEKDSLLQDEQSFAVSPSHSKIKTFFDESFMNKPTHFFSLVDKRASRYRYQIYKDVLQHWYYSPLNRLLLKLDVDSFIRRQPNSYFLTKNDEKLLHLKRQLFSEYYDTLRWYTYMEHYSTMKNQIGGTKSLLNRSYNQQFVGTFKKIRHLFNITPSFNDSTVLKFDQPLYNEYTNTQKTPLVQSSLLHEELLTDDFLVFKGGSLKNMPEDIQNQSAKILREYLTTAIPIRQEYMKKLLLEKNYWELTKFLFRGQKIRGDRPVTNETDFLNQEQKYLLIQNSETGKLNPENFKQDMWIALLKKCQNKLYDQEAIKNYVSLKKEKYENQKQKHKKYLKNRLERMKEAFLLQNSLVGDKKEQSKEILSQLQNISGYTSSVQKAMKESIVWEKNSLMNSSFQTIDKFFAKKNFLQKTNIRRNRPNIYLSLNKVANNPDFQKYNSISSEGINEKNRQSRFASKINIQKIHAEILKKTLHNSVKKRVVEIYKAENKFKENFALLPSKSTISHKTNKTSSKGIEKASFLFKPFLFAKNFLWNTFRFRKGDVFEKKSEDTRTKKSLFGEKNSKFSKIFQKFSSLFVENSKKNIDFWKKRENALSKRKKIRKTFKRLRNQYTVNEKIFFEPNDFQMSFEKKPSRQKLDKQNSSKENGEFELTRDFDFEALRSLQSKEKKEKFTHSQSWKKYFSLQSKQNSQIENTNNTSLFEKISSFQKNFFKKKFQRKRSRLRRYSSFKGRGPIKKRTLREKLKRQFKSLKKYGTFQDNGGTNQLQIEREKKKVELIQLITQRNYEASSLGLGGKFLKREKKQRRTRQMKHRVWKKKKQNYAQKRRKLRKRRRSTISKIRVFNKKLQRILSKKEIQTWWWQTFLPNFQTMTEKSWQLEKNMQIRKELFELSEKEIFERDQFLQNFEEKSLSPISQNFNLEKNLFPNSSNVLQIGDKDFQPLAIPEALRIREKLIQKEMLRFGNSSKISSENAFPSFENSQKSQNSFVQDTSFTTFENKKLNIQPSTSKESLQESEHFSATRQSQSNVDDFEKSLNILDKFTQNVLTPQKTFFTRGDSQLFRGINPIPFYAGWDENSRKFVVTNRLLSRKQCFSCSKATQTGNKNIFNKNEEIERNFSEEEFTKAPLRGMNAATTLYWQIPFTTYDPDQFFALGMDGFSPLGWRNFSFKHSKQVTKPILVKNFFSFNDSSSHEQNKSTSFSKNLQLKFFENTLKQKIVDSKNIFLSNKEIDKNFEYRRIMKKQKRIKKHPRPPVWFPSGSLSQQVLPVHYIYVFYKRSRLPRDRYIRRRLRTNFSKNENLDNSSIFTKITDFTLRKRTKPRRKYHRKRFVFENNQFVLRRRKFRGFFDEKETSRPSSKFFQTSSKQEKRTLKSKQRKKITDSKQNSENLRLRQLRRRVQRQVYRPVWRYRPRAGGFVWPGDYLRLELVKAPQLVSGIPEKNVENSKTSTRKIRKKKRRTLQEWQIQPKKYLLEKHNLKVLKKRLEKSSYVNM